MDSIDLVLISVVALVTGMVGQLTSRYVKGGWIVNLGSAFVGAVVGVQAARAFDLLPVFSIRYQKIDFPLIWALIGSVLFVALVGMFLRSGRR
jgi:uncharacterized membrane protein YeaQ/YmgE (transglycosylase-associated protein family)